MAQEQGVGGGSSNSSPVAARATRVISNPEFDARLTPSGAVDGQGKFMAARSKLYRGRLESAPTPGYISNSAIYQLRFLWNPTSVNHTSALDAQYLPTAVTLADPNSRGDASPFMQISQNISFNLLFDRTYETWVPSSRYLAKWGVLADIKVLYAMLGMFSASSVAADGDGQITVTTNGGLVEPDLIQQITPSSAHMTQPVWAVFGPLLKYYGMITSFSVDYTHFTQAMVPNRCVVQIGMQLIPKNHTRPLTRDQLTARGYASGPNGTGSRQNRRNI